MFNIRIYIFEIHFIVKYVKREFFHLDSHFQGSESSNRNPDTGIGENYFRLNKKSRNLRDFNI